MSSTQISKFDFSNRVFAILVILLVGLTTFWGVRVYQIWNTSSGADQRQITVEGNGSVEIVPDIAKLNLGVTVDAETAEDAATMGTEKSNSLMKSLEDSGIAKEDIKTTNYSVNPKYTWTSENGNKQDGFTMSQSVEVKIRDLKKVGDVIAASIQAGGNVVGGVVFDIDDMEKPKDIARADALKKIESKVAQISKVSGIKFGKVITYYEYSDGPIMYGMGGMATMEAAVDSKSVTAPNIEPGQQEVKLTVSITYKIK